MKIKTILNIKKPHRSIFGFEILTSLQSSLSCYFLLIIGRFLNPLFGSEKLQIITASFFNIVLNVSIVILIINLTFKRKQLSKIHFIFLNSFLYIYLPVAIYLIYKYTKYLIFIYF